MTKTELHELTKQWAHDRGLLTNGKVTTQALKLMSEYGELCLNLGNDTDIKDDIGDMLVVMTILAELDGYSLMDLFEPASEMDLKPGIMLLNNILGKLCDNAGKGYTIKTELSYVIWYLVDISNYSKLTLAECWEVAYNDIKDREGFLNTHGNFIKSTDPKYKQLKLQFDKEMRK